MHVHLCFPVAAADPLQLWLSPGIPLLFSPLLPPELSVPPVRAAVCQPTHTAATCPCSRHRDLRARTGDKKCLGSSTCLPGQHLHQPAVATVARGGENQRMPRLGEVLSRRILELTVLMCLFLKGVFCRGDFTSVHEEVSGQRMRWRCSLCEHLKGSVSDEL